MNNAVIGVSEFVPVHLCNSYSRSTLRLPRLSSSTRGLHFFYNRDNPFFYLKKCHFLSYSKITVTRNPLLSLFPLSKLGLLMVMLFLCSTHSLAQQAEEDYLDLSLDQLLSVQIAVVNRQQDHWFNQAAAVSVLTRSEIARSGATRLPELFRLIPGFMVSQINSNQWAVAVRGSQTSLSDKLLVLIDGRSVYTTLQGGVFWDSQEMDLETIERIEFIRGPGASAWGFNAVNGVINIISRRAEDYPSHSISGAIHSPTGSSVSAKVASKNADSAMLLTVYGVARPEFEMVNNQDAHDASELLQIGARYDTKWMNSDVALQARYYSGEVDQQLNLVTNSPPYRAGVLTTNQLEGGFIQGSLSRHLTEDISQTLSSYVDYYKRDNGVQFGEEKYVFSAEYIQSHRLTEDRSWSWGASYRYNEDDITNYFAVAFNPHHVDEQQWDVFSQYNAFLMDRTWQIGLGLKAEYSDRDEWHWLPNLRLSYLPNAQHTYWISASSAVRMATRLERDGEINLSVSNNDSLVTALLGNPNRQPEELFAYEAGARWQSQNQWYAELSAFHYQYKNLLTLEPGALQAPTAERPYALLPIYFDDELNANAWGGELVLSYQLNNAHRMRLQYSYLQDEITRLSPTAVLAQRPLRLSPETQTQWQWTATWTEAHSSFVALRYVDALFASTVPSYWALDLHWQWQWAKHWRLSVSGLNLNDDSHLEYGNALTGTTIPRQFLLQVRWY